MFVVGREWTWDQFFNSVEPIAASVPYMTCVGNHDVCAFSFGVCVCECMGCLWVCVVFCGVCGCV